MKWYTPDMNDGQTIFVFGSNMAGRHGAGAERGVGNGRQGQSYGIPTKDQQLRVLPLDKIKKFVGQFKGYAQQHPELHFLVTEVGCGLAGYAVYEIAPLFTDCPANCVMPDTWKNYETRHRHPETVQDPDECHRPEER